MGFNLKLDENHDIIVTRSAERTEKLDYTLQLVKCRLLTFLNEWYLDRNIGIPWTGVLDRSYDIAATKFAVQRTIETTVGVKSLDYLSMRADNDTRKLHIEFRATSIYGQIGTVVTL